MTEQEPGNPQPDTNPPHTHPETLDAKTHPCPCVERHSPQVHRTQGHHVLPQYAGGQAVHPDQPGFTKIQPLCPTGHDEVHMHLDNWAAEEAAFVKAGGPIAAYTPPPARHNNSVLDSIARLGWAAHKKYWPDKPFPRLGTHTPSPSSTPSTG